MRTHSLIASALAAAACIGTTHPALAVVFDPSSSQWPHSLEYATPASVHMDPAVLQGAADALDDAVAESHVKGAVLLVARHGRIVLHEAFGQRDGRNKMWEAMPSPPMPVDGIFDLESMTKPFTVFLAMKMQESGKYPGFSVNNPVVGYFPEFADPQDPTKASVTVRDLMRYASGEELDYLAGVVGDADPWHTMLTAPLAYTPSQKVLYSDLGFRLLGHVLEKVGGDSLQNLMKAFIFDPLGMADTSYRPAANMPDKSTRFAGTAWSDTRLRYLRGEVQDENDFWVEMTTGTPAHERLTGCDGVFSTALDLAKFAQMLLNRGKVVYGSDAHCGPVNASASAFAPLCLAKTVISAQAVHDMTTLQTGNLGLPTPSTTFAENLLYTGKGYGWELHDTGAWPGGDYTSPYAFSKTGGAGTFMLVDPDPTRDVIVVLLTNHGLPAPDLNNPNQVWEWPAFNAMIEDIRAVEVSNAVNLSLDVGSM
ncbi:serine hydrolase domain-containing protein [Sorangium sp. So ce131]|uniref:serine hydrolase domain-containing protein n=1 Tax=Sorangium sp. So ce131 TaxID=3133282 RepID=UPI003F613341